MDAQYTSEKINSIWKNCKEILKNCNLYNKENRERLWNRNFFAQTVYDAAVGDFDIRAAVKYDYNYYSACFSVIGLYEEHENQYSVKANRFAIKMYKSNFSFTTNHVNVFSEELYEKALRKICNRIHILNARPVCMKLEK